MHRFEKKSRAVQYRVLKATSVISSWKGQILFRPSSSKFSMRACDFVFVFARRSSWYYRVELVSWASTETKLSWAYIRERTKMKRGRAKPYLRKFGRRNRPDQMEQTFRDLLLGVGWILRAADLYGLFFFTRPYNPAQTIPTLLGGTLEGEDGDFFSFQTFGIF